VISGATPFGAGGKPDLGEVLKQPERRKQLTMAATVVNFDERAENMAKLLLLWLLLHVVVCTIMLILTQLNIHIYIINNYGLGHFQRDPAALD
jgi:hypothetical protein